MEPVSLVVGALAAGAIKGVGDTASSAISDAYLALKTAVQKRFAGNSRAEQALEEHAEDPETYERPLTKHLEETGAATDPRITELAEQLMRLLADSGMTSGGPHVDLRNAQGAQVGNNNQQTNYFR